MRSEVGDVMESKGGRCGSGYVTEGYSRMCWRGASSLQWPSQRISQVDVGAQKLGSAFLVAVERSEGAERSRRVRRAREASVAWGRRWSEKSMSSSMMSAVSSVVDRNLASISTVI